MSGPPSRPSSINNAVRQIPIADTFTAEHQISLLDHTRPAALSVDDQDAECTGSEAPTAPPTPGPAPLTKKLTNNSALLHQSLKREWTRRKYAKYDRGRYDLENEDPAAADEDVPPSQQRVGDTAAPTQTNYLERSRAKAKSFLKRKRTLGKGKHDQDAVLDILYENQRGLFFFGIPKYSSSSLLPSDPRPWQNAQFRTSPVDIRSAQVPDPSWEWVWKSWYVDMSRDVDEDGWEYSFQFAGNFAWHGNHPWFHSFVRRRRWLRMRRRKDAFQRTKEKSHELTADYFTIHPRTLRPPSENLSQAPSNELARMLAQAEELPDIEKVEITDIASLIYTLRKAAVDREKLVAVRKFIDEGGDELIYLTDRMPEIMSLFLYQSSRRQLLTELLQRYDTTHDRREILKEHQHDDEDAQKEHDATERRTENLMNAVKAADEQVKKLEYWSDIKGMAQGGETLHETSEGHWDTSKWQGLSNAAIGHPEATFASKQDASEGAHKLHSHPEHPSTADDSAAPSKKSSVFFDAKQSINTKESSDEMERYSTAAESASELSRKYSGKGKARASNLDGVDEVDDPGIAGTAQAVTPDVSNRRQKQSVQIIEPVPESAQEPQGGEDS